MTPLALAILSLCTVHVTPRGEPLYITHVRRHELGAEGYAQHVAHYVQDAAELQGVDPWLVLALMSEESGFNARSLEPRTGARGLMQLMPRGTYARAARRGCKAARGDVRTCLWLDVLHGTEALRDGIDACGSEFGGVSFYRTGSCAPHRRARRVMELRDRLTVEWGST